MPKTRSNTALIVLLIWIISCVTFKILGAYLPPLISVTFAFILFAFPGSQLLHLSKQPTSTTAKLVYGFACSIAITSLLGVLARILGQDFNFVFWGFISVGVIATVCITPVPANKISTNAVSKSDTVLIMIGLGLAALAIISIAATYNTYQLELGNQTLFYDLSWYFGKANHFLADPVYDWNDEFLNAAAPYPDRWLLVFWPLSQALITHFAGLHILDYQFAMMPSLLAIAILSLFQFGKELKLPTAWALLAALFQIALILFFFGIERPGEPFLRYLSNDPIFATFVLVPIFLAAALRFQQSQNIGSWVVFICIGIAIVTTHALGVAIGALVIFAYLAMNIVTQRSFNTALPLGLPTALFLSIFVLMRFINDRGNDAATSTAEAKSLAGIHYATFLNTDWIIANPSLLGKAFYLALGLSVICCLIYIRKQQFRLLLGYLVPVIGVCTPLLANGIAQLLTFEILWRLMWVFPFGLVFVTFAYALSEEDYLLKRLPKGPLILKCGMLAVPALLICSFAYNYAWQLQPGLSLLGRPAQASISETYADYKDLSNWLNQQPAGVHIADFSDHTIAHILSGNVQTLTKRNWVWAMVVTNGITETEATARVAAMQLLMNPATPANAQRNVIQDYNLDGLLLPSAEAARYTQAFSDCIVATVETPSWTLLQFDRPCK